QCRRAIQRDIVEREGLEAARRGEVDLNRGRRALGGKIEGEGRQFCGQDIAIAHTVAIGVEREIARACRARIAHRDRKERADQRARATVDGGEDADAVTVGGLKIVEGRRVQRTGR
ncbi:MAG: hypothetical protein AAFX99_37045, partial [Myxococcota bacterium]